MLPRPVSNLLAYCVVNEVEVAEEPLVPVEAQSPPLEAQSQPVEAQSSPAQVSFTDVEMWDPTRFSYPTPWQVKN